MTDSRETSEAATSSVPVKLLVSKIAGKACVHL